MSFVNPMTKEKVRFATEMVDKSKVEAKFGGEGFIAMVFSGVTFDPGEGLFDVRLRDGATESGV